MIGAPFDSQTGPFLGAGAGTFGNLAVVGGIWVPQANAQVFNGTLDTRVKYDGTRQNFGAGSSMITPNGAFDQWTFNLRGIAVVSANLIFNVAGAGGTILEADMGGFRYGHGEGGGAFSMIGINAVVLPVPGNNFILSIVCHNFNAGALTSNGGSDTRTALGIILFSG